MVEGSNLPLPGVWPGAVEATDGAALARMKTGCGRKCASRSTSRAATTSMTWATVLGGLGNARSSPVVLARDLTRVLRAVLAGSCPGGGKQHPVITRGRARRVDRLRLRCGMAGAGRTIHVLWRRITFSSLRHRLQRQQWPIRLHL